MPDVGPNYSLPPGYFVQAGETILPSQHNPVLEDLAAAANARLLRNGTSPMTGNLQMGSKQITGLAAASQPHHAPRFDQVTPRSAFMASASALALSANEMIYASGTNTAAKTPLTAFARTLLDDGNATTARATLGLGAVATDSVVPVSRGGTGSTTATSARAAINASSPPATITHSTGNTNEASSHTHRLDLGGVPYSTSTSDPLPRLFFMSGDDNSTLARIGDVSLRAMFNIAAASTTITAGDGLTGGGTLSGSRTISVGTPSSITRTSTNAASGNTHSHNLPQNDFRDMMANYLTAGVLGGFAFAKQVSGTLQSFGGSTSGANLRTFALTSGAEDEGGSLSGTWMCLGAGQGGRGTLWQRIA